MHVPTELIIEIASFFAHPLDLLHLSLCAKRFYRVLLKPIEEDTPRGQQLQALWIEKRYENETLDPAAPWITLPDERVSLYAYQPYCITPYLVHTNVVHGPKELYFVLCKDIEGRFYESQREIKELIESKGKRTAIWYYKSGKLLWRKDLYPHYSRENRRLAHYFYQPDRSIILRDSCVNNPKVYISRLVERQAVGPTDVYWSATSPLRKKSYYEYRYHLPKDQVGANQKWNEQGILIKSRQFVRYWYHGLLEEWTAKGIRTKTVTYWHGQLHGLQRYFWPNGVIRKLEDRKYHQRSGYSEKWNNKGVRVVSAQYLNGRRVGQYYAWSADGILILSTQFQADGKKTGECFTWWPNAIIRSVSTYENGLKNGKQTFWTKKGTKEKEYVWKAGVLLSAEPPLLPGSVQLQQLRKQKKSTIKRVPAEEKH